MSAGTDLPALDWPSARLAGRVLIEASAGTGKTHNIGLLYLRLLLEQGLGVERVLVSTFTEAAAQELRERLRQRLIEAERLLVAIAAGDPHFDYAPDSLAAYLRDRFGTESDMALRRVRLARADFDRAPIATIHALCQRIRRDHPLDSGAGFGTRRLVDEHVLLRECVEDFWRRRYLAGGVDELEAETVLPGGVEGLLGDLERLIALDAEVVHGDGLAKLDAALAHMRTNDSVAALRALAMDRSVYRTGVRAMPERIRRMADALGGGDASLDAFAPLREAYFGAKLAEQVVDVEAARHAHPILGDLLALRALIERRSVFARGRVLAAALAFCREEMPRRARRRDAQTYAMLIDETHASLVDARTGAAFAERLFRAFPAALIDEFQDTDRRQFEIFDRIYRDHSGMPRGTLVMIGDPKQAIFAFRGGDIAAYLAASAQASARYSLATNHRSSAALVGALNALYAGAGGGFGNALIRYRSVAASGRADEKPYCRGDVPVTTPLVFHRFADDAAAGLPELDAAALDDCADRIVALLNDGTCTLGNRRVTPGDVAVLLPRNDDIAKMRRLLGERRVPCVGSERGSVFATETARELEIVIHAVLNAGDDRAVRGALTTRLFGAGFAALARWREDADAFERELERFAAWRELARERGVLAVIGALLAERGAALLGLPDGERVVTDLRHLGELMASEEAAQHGLEGVHAWLAAERAAAREDDAPMEETDARRLRVESDARRVQLLTVHVAKGREFPVVFLPLAWRPRERSGANAPRVLRFHDADGRARIDLGSAEFAANSVRHFDEDFQERLRLLYVALTRASHALHVYWIDRGEPAEGLKRWNQAALDALIRSAAEAFGADAKFSLLDALAARLPGIGVAGPYRGGGMAYLPPAEIDATPAPAPALPARRQQEALWSFSRLRAQSEHAAGDAGAADELAAVDAGMPARDVSAEEPDDARLIALDALRGPRFGNAVHAILEHAAPGRVWPDQARLVAAELATHAAGALRGEGVESTARLIDRVRAADLGAGLRLADLEPGRRAAEFEFQLPLHGASLAGLRALCERHGLGEAIPTGLDSGTLRGMLTGYVDLIFAHDGRYHVLDYKTNRLGARVADYAGPRLDAAMRAHGYALQALLYTVALHRYLGERLDGYTPERDLGDSWYVFVRAVGLREGAGVWRRRWPAALIRALDDAFAGATGAVA